MVLDEGGVGSCNRKLRVCVARTVSGKGVVMMEGVGCVCTILRMYVLLGGDVGGTMCMCCSKSTLGKEPHSDSSEEESETVSHDSASSSQ